MRKIILFFICVVFAFSQQNGLRKASLTSEENLVLQDFAYSSDAPGTSTRFDRSFENSPPLIPHDLDGLLPITLELNMCTTCHMPEFAKDIGSTAIPKSHLVDLRTGKDLHGELDMTRYNCVQCHVPQSNAKTVVNNKFEAVFRDKVLKHGSNLLDVLNQGVE